MFSEGEKLSLERKFGTGMKDEVTLVVFADDTALAEDLVGTANSLAALGPKIKVEVEKVVDGKNQRMGDMRIQNYQSWSLSRGSSTG